VLPPARRAREPVVVEAVRGPAVAVRGVRRAEPERAVRERRVRVADVAEEVDRGRREEERGGDAARGCGQWELPSCRAGGCADLWTGASPHRYEKRSQRG
jgi:hypothetical protein